MNQSSDETPGVFDPALARDGVASADSRATTVPVLEEALQVDKVRVDQGGYRVTKRIEVIDGKVDELLRYEHVTIERRPIGQPVTEMPVARYEGETLIVPVVEEVLVTEKRLVLVEEVRITRIHGTTQEQREVALRKEHVEIERLGAETR